MFRFAPPTPPGGPPTPSPTGGPDPTQAPPDPTNPAQDPSPSPDDDSSDLPSMAHKVSPMVAVYKGPEMGPFMCSNCHFYETGSGDSGDGPIDPTNPDPSNNPSSGQGSCSIVDGPIDPNGVCNLFSSGGSGDEGEVKSPDDEGSEEASGAQGPPDDSKIAPSEDETGS